MKVAEAKSQILELLSSQLTKSQLAQCIGSISPDEGDSNKFSVLGKPARAIHRYDGWHIPVNLAWFSGSLDLPTIRNGEFYWYAIAIPKYSAFTRPHYHICDYIKMRDWVLEFDAPLGVDYRNHNSWRADIELCEDAQSENMGYFRWGDEPHGVQDRPSRIVMLDNIHELLEQPPDALHGHRVIAEVSRLVRDTKIVRELKTLYGGRCQVCGALVGSVYEPYSEAHHVKPLGDPHNGPDTRDNILILCPNHHAEFDLGYIAVQPKTLTIIHVDPRNQFNSASLRIAQGHSLSAKYLEYHYRFIFRRSAA